MARTVGIGLQNFRKIREQNLFYIDKTMFIKQWWEARDEVTLITLTNKKSDSTGQIPAAIVLSGR